MNNESDFLFVEIPCNKEDDLDTFYKLYPNDDFYKPYRERHPEKIIQCTHPVTFEPLHIWTRYPLSTTRMWNMMSIFDVPAYICFFTSLTLTVVLMKFYTYLGKVLNKKKIRNFPLRV